MHMPLIKLIQHVCTKIPDKAEYRNKMAVVSIAEPREGGLIVFAWVEKGHFSGVIFMDLGNPQKPFSKLFVRDLL